MEMPMTTTFPTINAQAIIRGHGFGPNCQGFGPYSADKVKVQIHSTPSQVVLTLSPSDAQYLRTSPVRGPGGVLDEVVQFSVPGCVGGGYASKTTTKMEVVINEPFEMTRIYNNNVFKQELQMYIAAIRLAAAKVEPEQAKALQALSAGLEGLVG
jgi:hypothetical protein